MHRDFVFGETRSVRSAELLAESHFALCSPVQQEWQLTEAPNHKVAKVPDFRITSTEGQEIRKAEIVIDLGNRMNLGEFV